MEPFTPIEPPPPAYGEEQDFDRKIADALSYSLHISPHSAGRRAARERDAAYRRHLPHPEKLRLRTVNAHDTASPTSPHRAPSTSSRRLPTSPLSLTPARENPTRLAPRVSDNSIVEEEEDSPGEELPAFTERGPSLDGPPYSQVVRVQPRHHHVRSDSPPQSPLDDDDDDEHDFDSPPRASSTPHPRRPTIGTSQRSSSRGGYVREHVSSTMPPTAGRPVRAASAPGRPPNIPFDPAVAYATDQPVSISSKQSRGTMDPSALYSSAVSSLYSPSRPQLPKKYNTLNRMPSVGTVSYAPHIPDTTHPSQASSSPHASVVSPGPLPLLPQGNPYGTPTPHQQSYSQHQSSYSSSQLYHHQPQQQPHTPQRQPYSQHLQQHASPTQQQQHYVTQQYASPAAPRQLPYTPPRY